MTNKERLLQDGNNCPYDCISKIKGTQGCPDKCKEQRVDDLSCSAKGRRWLDDECEGE